MPCFLEICGVITQDNFRGQLISVFLLCSLGIKAGGFYVRPPVCTGEVETLCFLKHELWDFQLRVRLY